jgi:hypothetical protein
MSDRRTTTSGLRKLLRRLYPSTVEVQSGRSQVGTTLRDTKGVVDIALAERLDLQSNHRTSISIHEQGLRLDILYEHRHRVRLADADWVSPHTRPGISGLASARTTA